jgi:serine-type D-Ala-D-Ala carboxypeptidase/endopeptidase
MNNLLNVYVVGCGLLFSVLGALRLLSTFPTGRGVSPAGEPTSGPSEAVKAEVHALVRTKRIGGIFWFCLGVATLTIWFSLDDTRDSWGLPTFGVLWGAMVYFLRLRVGISPAVVPQTREQNGRLAAIVTPYVERAFKKYGHIGLVVGAIANDEEMLLGYGARQLGDSRPPDADTVFEIGSISKVFTGILLAQRIESGELGLDDRISELLPEGWSLSESSREITLRHCTTHTSGLPRLPANLLGISDLFNLAFLGGDPYRDYTEEEFRDALASVALKYEPGTKHDYSNFAVGLLGFALATRNGSDYETLVTSKICKPLGMHRTRITNDEWHQEHMPAKYRSVANQGLVCFAFESNEWRFPNHLAGAGAIRSTGRDMMTFLKANMGLIPTPIDAAIRRSHQELFRERADRAIGMNWIRSLESTISQNIIWHNGGTGGFRTYLGFTEDHQFGILVLSNNASIVGVDALAQEILKAIVRVYAPGSRKPVTEHG